MNKDEFLRFASQVQWRFAKTVPNWPHFYIVEKDLSDAAAFRAARVFVKEFGYIGKFFDRDVCYFDAEGWTYWASPLVEPIESQYMLNRCKTEYSYRSLAKTRELPVEGFRESGLSLSPVLEDPEFQSLLRDTEGGDFTVFDVLGTADYEIRHSNVLAWLLDRTGNHRQGPSFLTSLWRVIANEHTVPELSFQEYSVVREGASEDEKIDLLLVAKNRDWIIVIENKLFSPETGDQLDRYFHYIERQYGDVPCRRYFYLTPDGIAPAKEEDSTKWTPISYALVKQALVQFQDKPHPDRIRHFLNQYLEHIEKNVLKSKGTIEKQRSILRRHARTFHSLTYLLEEEYIQRQCSEVTFNLLKSTLAVQHEVGRELFEWTKQMMAKHGYSRHSGLGHWITIEPPRLRDRLIQSSLVKPNEALPIVFAFDSRANSYVVEIWLYKNKRLSSKVKGRLSLRSPERPEPNRGDEHLVEVLYRKTVINSDEIIRGNLAELKQKIAVFFESYLKTILEKSVAEIGIALDSIVSHDKTTDLGQTYPK
jgi:hypothetical protein